MANNNYGMSVARFEHIERYTKDYDVNIDTGEVKAPSGTAGTINSKGYRVLTIRGKVVRTHQIIAHRVFGAACIGKQVNHKDGDKLNNASSNLELVTLADNMKHAQENGLYLGNTGEQSPNSKLTEDKVSYIRSSGKVSTELARELGVSPRTIRGVRKRETWKHVI